MATSSENTTIDVDTGEIGVSAGPAILQSVALGSCVAVAVYERERHIAGLAHIMLPGSSPGTGTNTKYAEDAIRTLLDRLKELGAETRNLEISIVGGANVLQEGDIPDKVIASVLNHLMELNLEVKRIRVGGIRRRSLFMDVESGQVFYTEGDDTSRKPLVGIAII